MLILISFMYYVWMILHLRFRVVHMMVSQSRNVVKKQMVDLGLYPVDPQDASRPELGSRMVLGPGQLSQSCRKQVTVVRNANVGGLP